MVERRVDTGGGSHGQSQSRCGWRQDMKKILVAMLALGVLIGVVAIVSICVAWTLADRVLLAARPAARSAGATNAVN